jgi:hypothetical protein
MELFAQTISPSSLFLVVLMIAVGLLLMRSHRHFSQATRRELPSLRTRPPKPQPLAHHLEGGSELVQWEVQMHDLARSLSGQLDSKMSALGQLIREADRAAARLEAALAAVQPPSPPPTASAAEPPHPRPPEPRSQADALKAASVEPSASRSTPSTPETAGRTPNDRRYEEIYLLADYGFDPAEIARRVGMPIGEIQLILSLRSKR